MTIRDLLNKWDENVEIKICECAEENEKIVIWTRLIYMEAIKDEILNKDVKNILWDGDRRVLIIKISKSPSDD